MTVLPAAIYARVSSEQQAGAQTIASQLAALRERVAADGFALPEELTFVDDGVSGATLVRPGLERLRDLAAAGGLDRLYVHSPDRLARKYAYQVLLLDELARVGVAVVFLNRAPGSTPEDELLLQVQGMVAEYERAKSLERARRGKLHAARTGAVSVLGHAPYGYRYVRKADGGGQARYEVLPAEARVVRQVFAWVGRERLSMAEVARRRQAAGIATKSGKPRRDRSLIWAMLRNPAYKGEAAFGKSRVGPWPPPLRPVRGRPAQPKRPASVAATPPEERITVPVPPLVSAELFEAVQEQLAENRRRARRDRRGTQFLLQGLAVCACCGRLRRGLARLIDGYADGLLDQDEFAPRVRRLKERIAALEAAARTAAEDEAQRHELRLVIGQVEAFAATVGERLESLTPEQRRAVVRAVVKRVEVDYEHVQVVFRIRPGPLALDNEAPISQDCWGRRSAAACARRSRPHRRRGPAGWSARARGGSGAAGCPGSPAGRGLPRGAPPPRRRARRRLLPAR